MARLHGKKGLVKIGESTVAAVSSFSYDETADSIDATAMGDTSKNYLGGLRDGSGSIEARYESTDYASAKGQGDLLAALEAGTGVIVDLQLDSDVTSGEFAGLSGDTAIINSFSFSQGFDDVVTVTFGFQGTLSHYSGV